MHRLRSTWLALMGGALLIALSVSTAFGAPPTERDGPRGQEISAFVHELIFGTEEDTDEDEVVEEEPAGEDEAGEETVDRQVPDGFANHGECVSEATKDTAGFEASESATKGEWVSEHARYVCWGLPVPGEEPEEEVDEDSTTDEGEDADEAAAKEQHKAEREAAKAERKAEQAAAHAERNAAKAARAANRGGGKGNGH